MSVPAVAVAVGAVVVMLAVVGAGMGLAWLVGVVIERVRGGDR